MKHPSCTVFETWKFNAVDDLLTANHNGYTQMRISINPQEIRKKVEFGTSSLKERIIAANKMGDFIRKLTQKYLPKATKSYIV